MSPWLLKILFAIAISLVAKCSAKADAYCAPQTLLLYKARWCSVCKDAERYLNANGVSFVAQDIDELGLQRWAYAMGGIPIFDLGKSFVRGFDRRELDAKLCIR